ncbi:hypothetical protein L0F81_00035 [Streptomyces tricolor]|uniref:J domain-containing protein n=1 Tax=Streptomyces tricolor TaxID=68277 RepID=A0ABS9J7Z2_9ACTN|nr:hypothetical protein [Streptomyces tricolor]MCG0061687.1 hypothetical protein [Streptomyces tricolor]
MADLAHAEFLYELWDANWDEGPLGNYQILAHPITKKTPKRIYFVFLNQRRTSFVDRQKIEAAGEVYHGYTMRRLHLTPPEIPDREKKPSLPELRKAMADAHPDRGGSDEAFIAARRRYEAARLSA